MKMRAYVMLGLALLLAFVAAGIITAAELLSNAVENEMTDTAGCIENGAC